MSAPRVVQGPRRPDLDLLRSVALVCIVLAHVEPPARVLELRDFDVVLMMMVSGGASSISSHSVRSTSTLLRRLRRLVCPTYLFFSVFYTVEWLLGTPPSLRVILDTALLTNSVGYVWIIRVFVLMAIFGPLVAGLGILSSPRRVLLGSAFLLVLNELMIIGVQRAGGNTRWGSVVMSVVPYTVGYLLPHLLGTVLVSARTRVRVATSALAGALWMLIESFSALDSGELISVQSQKYPPRAVYLVYGVFVGSALWALAPQLWRFASKSRFLTGLVSFIGQNSMWIYLWHICLVPWWARALPGGDEWPLRWLAVVVSATFIQRVQFLVVTSAVGSREPSSRAATEVGRLLTG